MVLALSTFALLCSQLTADVLPIDPQTTRSQEFLIREVSKMTDEEQVALYLGAHQSQSSQDWRYREEERVERFLADPAIGAAFSEVDIQWFAGVPAGPYGAPALFSSRRELIQLRAMVARNLYFRSVPVSRESVADASARIVELRQQYWNTPVFAGRTVLFAASAEERWVGSELRFTFGMGTVQKSLRHQARNFSFLRSIDRRARERLLQEIEGASDLTFFFEGHARSDALDFDGEWSPEGLATALSEHRDRRETMILVLSACQSHHFMRDLLALLGGRSDAPIPVVISPEEYGQDYFKPVFNDRFLQRDLGLWKGAVSIGDLVVRARIPTSVYVPDAHGIATQIL